MDNRKRTRIRLNGNRYDFGPTKELLTPAQAKLQAQVISLVRKNLADLDPDSIHPIAKITSQIVSKQQHKKQTIDWDDIAYDLADCFDDMQLITLLDELIEPCRIERPLTYAELLEGYQRLEKRIEELEAQTHG